MDTASIYITDLVIVAVLVLSGLFAFWRGFVHEVLAVAGWVGAALATLFLFPVTKQFARSYIDLVIVADLITGAVIFVVTLAVLIWITHRISSQVRGSALSALDRSLGFLFGLVRGAVLISLAWLVLVALVPRKDLPSWITEARALPLVALGGEFLLAIVPDKAFEESQEKAKAASEGARKSGEALIDDAAERIGDKVIEELERQADQALEAPADDTPPPANSPDSEDEKGYTRGDRRQLDRLFGDQEN